MTNSLRILALNPYHGGSHRAFLDEWGEHSRHDFHVLTLPPYKWKWRMRHAAVTFAQKLEDRCHGEHDWDVLFCTDMLNLAELLGLCIPSIRDLPRIVYFHENQLTYPNREDRERDLHFAFTNITTALAANRIWFNSAFHRDEFLSAVDEWMRRMPDYQLLDAADTIRAKSSIQPPGILSTPLSKLLHHEARGRVDKEDPIEELPPFLRIVWVSRWEYDKDPDTFFAALRLLRDRGFAFRLNVLGESFGNAPSVFEESKCDLAEYIDHWGFASSREKYEGLLLNSDVVVSTAKHEFFGIAVLEAVAAGCFPLVPRSLAYPEVLGCHKDFFHDGTSHGLADRLSELCRRIATAESCWPEVQLTDRIVEQYNWPARAAVMDEELAITVRHRPGDDI